MMGVSRRGQSQSAATAAGKGHGTGMKAVQNNDWRICNAAKMSWPKDTGQRNVDSMEG